MRMMFHDSALNTHIFGRINQHPFTAARRFCDRFPLIMSTLLVFCPLPGRAAEWLNGLRSVDWPGWGVAGRTGECGRTGLGSGCPDRGLGSVSGRARRRPSDVSLRPLQSPPLTPDKSQIRHRLLNQLQVLTGTGNRQPPGRITK